MTETADTYPELAQFIGAHFHQDMDLFGETNDDIMAEWASGAHPSLCATLAAEIDAFLAAHPVAPLEAFNTLFVPDMPLADDDAGLVETLISMRNIATHGPHDRQH